MKKLIYLLLFLVVGITNAQRTGSTMLLVSQQQFANEVTPIYNQDDAASPTESNTVGVDWNEDTSQGTITSYGSDSQEGSYSIALERTNTGTLEHDFWLDLEIGETYQYEVWVKRIAGDNDLTVHLRVAAGWDVGKSSNTTSTTWTKITLTDVADASSSRFSFKLNNVSAIGTIWLIDNIIVTKL